MTSIKLLKRLFFLLIYAKNELCWEKIFFLAPFFQRIGWFVRPQIMFPLMKQSDLIRGAPINRFIFMRWFNVRLNTNTKCLLIFQIFYWSLKAIEEENILLLLKNFNISIKATWRKKKHPQKTRRHLKEFTSLIIIKPGYTNNAIKDCMTANSSRQKNPNFWTSFYWDKNHKNV